MNVQQAVSWPRPHGGCVLLIRDVQNSPPPVPSEFCSPLLASRTVGIKLTLKGGWGHRRVHRCRFTLVSSCRHVAGYSGLNGRSLHGIRDGDRAAQLLGREARGGSEQRACRAGVRACHRWDRWQDDGEVRRRHEERAQIMWQMCAREWTIEPLSAARGKLQREQAICNTFTRYGRTKQKLFRSRDTLYVFPSEFSKMGGANTPPCEPVITWSWHINWPRLPNRCQGHTVL